MSAAAAPSAPRVDVWLCYAAQASPALLDACRDLLDEDERHRLGRFRREEDARCYLLAHGLLRSVLAERTGQPPHQIAFTVNAWGKPALRDTAGRALHFNLSHTRGLVALAVCDTAELGIDVEATSQDIDVSDLARKYFSAHECAFLEATPADRRLARFIELWTLKEAWIKAVGQGLSMALDSFSVRLAPPPPRIVEHAADGDREAHGQCRLYTPSPGYRLALAVRDPTDHLDVGFCVVGQAG